MAMKPRKQPHVYTKSTLKDDMNHAHWCLINREYDTAKRLLLKILTNRESDSYRIFYMLGVTSFEENDIHTSQKYFLTVLEKEKQHTVSMLYLAVISILRDERQEGIRYLLDAQSQLRSKTKGKNSRYIKRALEYIKQYASDDEKLLQIFNEPYKNKILPEFGIIDRRKKVVRNFSILFLIIAVIIGGGVYFYVNTLTKIINPDNERSRTFYEIEENLKKKEDKELGLDKVRIQLSNRQYNKLMNQIKNDFINYRDNEVWINANMILYSDRSVSEKNKVSMILENLSGVSYASDTTWFDFEDVAQDTWKFENVIIKWSGTLANVVSLENTSDEDIFGTQAQFLVGFLGESSELKASVALYIPREVQITSGKNVEILGRIKLLSPWDKSNNDFSLELISYKYLLDGETE